MSKRSIWLPLLLALAAIVACAPAEDRAGGGEAEDGEEAHADRMAEEHEGDTADPSPAAAAEPSAPVRATEVVYANVDGQDVTGYLARP